MPDIQLPRPVFPKDFKDAAPLRHTFTPGISTQLNVQTTPGALCTMHLDGDSDPTLILNAYADPDGIARFHINPSAESDQIAQLVIDCVGPTGTDNQPAPATRIPLYIRSSRTPTPDMPAPPVESALTLRKGRALTPLTVDEASRITDEQALARNLPLRPDPDQTPRAYQTWLRAVTSPLTSVDPALIDNPRVTHAKCHDKSKQAGPESSFNWSGFELDRTFRITGPIRGGGHVTITPPYDWVGGEWIVPNAFSEPNKTDYSSLWVGLDGDGLTDLVQAGTEQECTNFSFGAININTGSFYAWTEFLPQQPSEQVVSGFPVSPGDLMLVHVWIGDAGASPSLSGAFGVFNLLNLTRGYSTWVYTPVGTTSVSGAEAVWIMERPTIGGVLPDLANYGVATLFGASARQTTGSFIAYQGARNQQISMMNDTSTTTLSTVSAISSDTMLFNWKAFS